MVMRRTICGLIGALSAFSGASAYGKIFDLTDVETWKADEQLSALPPVAAAFYHTV